MFSQDFSWEIHIPYETKRDISGKKALVLRQNWIQPNVTASCTHTVKKAVIHVLESVADYIATIIGLMPCPSTGPKQNY